MPSIYKNISCTLHTRMQGVVNNVPITTWVTAVTHMYNEYNAHDFRTDYNQI